MARGPTGSARRRRWDAPVSVKTSRHGGTGKYFYEVRVSPRIQATSSPEYDSAEDARKAGEKEEEALKREARKA